MAAISNSRTGRKNGTTNGWSARALHWLNNAWYLVVLDTSAVKIRVYKGTDGSTWTEQDSADALTHSANTASYGVGNDGTDLFICYHTATNTVRTRKFLTGTDQWDTADVGAANMMTLCGPDYNKSVAIRSDGDVIVYLYQTNVTRGQIYRYEGSSWGQTSPDATTGYPLDFVMTASSDMAQFVFVNSGTTDLRNRSLTSANSGGAGSVSVDNSITNMFCAQMGYINDGGTHRAALAYVDSDGSLAFAYSNTAGTANSITNVVTGVSPTSTTDPGLMGAVVVPYDNKWHVIWSGDGRGSIHMDISDDYASPAFTTDTNVITGLGNDPIICAAASPDGILVVYTDETAGSVNSVWAVEAGGPVSLSVPASTATALAPVPTVSGGANTIRSFAVLIG